MRALPFFRRPGPVLRGARVVLRLPGAADFSEWAALRRESRSFLERWEPRWSRDELDASGWRERLRRYRREFANGTGVPFFVIDIESSRIAGGISVGNIRYGVSRSGQIGYWMGERFAGRGLMVEAVELTAAYCFDTLRLHRLEAACIPDNTRSVRVLEKAGFTREGLLRSYLRINGSWQDHSLYALIEGKNQIRRFRG